ncbi:hypothetical protein KC363_g159 [Hortaea werneckii]|nr:hypothetical protein KC363_g159 [Hortaea werneckii]
MIFSSFFLSASLLSRMSLPRADSIWSTRAILHTHHAHIDPISELQIEKLMTNGGVVLNLHLISQYCFSKGENLPHAIGGICQPRITFRRIRGMCLLLLARGCILLPFLLLHVRHFSRFCRRRGLRVVRNDGGEEGLVELFRDVVFEVFCLLLFDLCSSPSSSSTTKSSISAELAVEDYAGLQPE